MAQKFGFTVERRESHYARRELVVMFYEIENWISQISGTGIYVNSVAEITWDSYARTERNADGIRVSGYSPWDNNGVKTVKAIVSKEDVQIFSRLANRILRAADDYLNGISPDALLKKLHSRGVKRLIRDEREDGRYIYADNIKPDNYSRFVAVVDDGKEFEAVIAVDEDSAKAELLTKLAEKVATGHFSNLTEKFTTWITDGMPVKKADYAESPDTRPIEEIVNADMTYITYDGRVCDGIGNVIEEKVDEAAVEEMEITVENFFGDGEQE